MDWEPAPSIADIMLLMKRDCRQKTCDILYEDEPILLLPHLRPHGGPSTGKPLHIPCTTELKAALAHAPRTGLFIATRADGRPLPYRRKAMLEERKRLGLEAYDLHPPRCRAVMELAWAGCDDREIATCSGHSSVDMIGKSVGIARQINRARSAQEKRRLWASPGALRTEQKRNGKLMARVITC
jgi:integrase